MKLSRILFKPKWQDPDASVRAAAVAADPDPSLVAALPELTRGDPDSRVRLAALKRLGDYERWRERSTADGDAELRRIARSTYVTLLCSAAGRPPLKRCIAELETLAPAELETVAAGAADRDLRAAALRYVTRISVLAQRAVEDPDPELRLACLARIEDAAALERIATRARKTDKIVSRAARDRLAALRIGGGDAETIATHARKLCDRLEDMLRRPGSDDARVRVETENEWSAFADRIPAPIAARFAGTLALIDRMSLAPVPAMPTGPSSPRDPSTTPAGEPCIEREAEPVAILAAAPAAAPEIEATANAAHGNALAPPAAETGEQAAAAFASKARFDAALAAHQERARLEREQRQARLQQIDSLLAPYQARLDAGDTAAASALHALIAEAGRDAGGIPRDLEHRVAPLHARLAELRRWQHWSNQRRRRALCDEIDGLPALGMHPDAVATRIREARDEWNRLDAMESLAPGDATQAAGLARRFHGVCQRALKPAGAYFEKRAELRDTHAQALEALLARAAEFAADSRDWKGLAATRRELSTALRMLDDVDPRSRHRLARSLKESIAALSARIDAHAHEVESAKARLIERASALAAQPDRSAPRAARELQQQWTALGEGARGADQRQWREFRAACDRVFAGLDAQRQQTDAHAAEQAALAQAIVGEAEAVVAQPGLSAEELVARRRELENRWRGAASPDRALAQQFEKKIAALKNRETQIARSARLGRYIDALARFRALRSIERGAAGVEWTSEGLDTPFAVPLAERRTRPQASDPGDADALEAAHELLVKLEFVAGIASPAEDRERRMNFQVKRLSARMRGGDADPDGSLDALIAAWFKLPAGLPDELEARFDNAADAALSLLP